MVGGTQTQVSPTPMSHNTNKSHSEKNTRLKGSRVLPLDVSVILGESPIESWFPHP